jgi:hypothetical protein
MDNHGAPPKVVDAIKRYVDSRLPPGGFVTAVLANDLRESLVRADHINRHYIREIVTYCWNEIPASCWGSYEKVDMWLRGETK